MKLTKIFFIFLLSLFLSGCIQSTALLGPGITIATTGNILQAGFQYGASKAIKNETGKDTFLHLKNTVNPKKKEEKFKIKFKKLVKKKFKSTRKKLFIN